MHRADTIALGSGARDVMRIGRHAEANDLGVDFRAASARVLILLKNQDRSPLAHDESIAIAIERPGSLGGVIVVLA